MIQVNRIYLIFNRLVTKKFLVDTSDFNYLPQSYAYYQYIEPLITQTQTLITLKMRRRTIKLNIIH